MLDQEHRPKRFSEIIGQDGAVSVMQSVVKSPDLATRAYIFHGEYGTGKTSLAGVFARTLLCTNRNGVEACLECANCKSVINGGIDFIEIDVSQVEDVGFIQRFKEQLYYINSSSKWRVVVFDEVQCADGKSQDALLKLLEDGPRNIFFILNTTEIDKVKETIVSRAIPLTFMLVPDIKIIELLKSIALKEKLSIDNDLIECIAQSSFGHVRSAVKRLNLFQQMGNKEEFLKSIKIPDKGIIDLFLAMKSQDRLLFEEKITYLLSVPLAYLRKYFELFVLNCLKEFSGKSCGSMSSEYKRVIDAYGSVVLNFPALLSQDWVFNSFKSDIALQGFLWYVYNTMSSGTTASGAQVSTPSRFKKV